MNRCITIRVLLQNKGKNLAYSFGALRIELQKIIDLAKDIFSDIKKSAPELDRTQPVKTTLLQSISAPLKSASPTLIFMKEEVPTVKITKSALSSAAKQVTDLRRKFVIEYDDMTTSLDSYNSQTPSMKQCFDTISDQLETWFEKSQKITTIAELNTHYLSLSPDLITFSQFNKFVSETFRILKGLDESYLLKNIKEVIDHCYKNITETHKSEAAFVTLYDSLSVHLQKMGPAPTLLKSGIPLTLELAKILKEPITLQQYQTFKDKISSQRLQFDKK